MTVWCLFLYIKNFKTGTCTVVLVKNIILDLEKDKLYCKNQNISVIFIMQVSRLELSNSFSP